MTIGQFTVAHKCQSSYTETRNTTIRCFAADSTFATQRIVVLWSHNTTPTQNPTTQQLLCHGFVWQYCCVVVFNSQHKICCVVADNSQRWSHFATEVEAMVEAIHYYHGNIIILLYLSMFFCVSQYQFNFRCKLASASGDTTICCVVSCQRQYNKL